MTRLINGLPQIIVSSCTLYFVCVGQMSLNNDVLLFLSSCIFHPRFNETIFSKIKHRTFLQISKEWLIECKLSTDNASGTDVPRGTLRMNNKIPEGPCE